MGDGSSQVSSVTLKSRCDANGWGHTQFTVEVQVGTGAPCLAPILGTGSARLSGIANQVTCGTYTGTVAQCSTVEIKCAAATTVTLRSRCDANAWSCSVPNSITVEVRVGTSAIATAGQKGQLTGGQTCGLKTGCDASACTTHTITCAPALASATHITVQMLDATNTFLMLDEVTWA